MTPYRVLVLSIGAVMLLASLAALGCSTGPAMAGLALLGAACGSVITAAGLRGVEK